MDKDKKYDERDHQEENKRTSPTDIKGKIKAQRTVRVWTLI